MRHVEFILYLTVFLWYKQLFVDSDLIYNLFRMKGLKGHSWIISVAVIVLVAIGVMTLYSVTLGGVDELKARNQLFFAISGVILYFFVSAIRGDDLKYPLLSLTIYIFCILGLIVTLLFGVDIRGARRWIAISDQFTLQFGEFVKIGIIVVIASITNWSQEYGAHKAYKKVKKAMDFLNKIRSFVLKSPWILTILLCIPPVILLVFQPAYGTAGLVLVSGLMTAFFAEKRKDKVFFAGVIVSLAAAFVFYFTNYFSDKSFKIYIPILLGVVLIAVMMLSLFFKKMGWPFLLVFLSLGALAGYGIKTNVWNKILLPYQLERLSAFVGSNRQEAIEFQTKQSIIAIGSGQLFGKGFGQGSQSKLRFLPDYYTDFIFAAFAEEFGLVGTVLLLLTYLSLFLALLRKADRVHEGFQQVLIQGITMLLIIQFSVNVGMNIGIFPVIGIPLPFMSYGGSSLWTWLLLVGIAQSFEEKPVENVEIANIRGWLEEVGP